MNYHIIDKLTWDNNTQEMITEEVGYTTKVEDYNYLQNNYNTTLGSFIENNKTELENGIKSLYEFFQNTTIVYACFTTTDNIDGYGFTEEFSVI
jgi:hypothetical protein